MRSSLLIARVAPVGVLACLAFPSDGSGYVSSHPVSLGATGPLPSTLKVDAGNYMLFYNRDSVAHTVVFANGRCSLTLSPGEHAGPGNELGPDNPDCRDNFMFYVGNYAYAVDGRVPGTVDTVPASRSVTLTARTHTIRRGERLMLHGQVTWNNDCCEFATKAPFPVNVLARHAGTHTYKAIATVSLGGSPDASDVWHLKVRPGTATTYVAEVTGQLPAGQIWKPGKSRPFTVTTGTVGPLSR